MRVSVDIPDNQIAELAELARSENTSRAALVREALAGLLAAKRRSSQDAIETAFGLWSGMEEDGLAYQERLRRDW